MRKAGFGIRLCVAVAIGLPAVASAQEQQSVNALLAKGCEIRSVAVPPLDAGKQVSGDAIGDTVVVTMQNKASLGNPVICGVR